MGHFLLSAESRFSAAHTLPGVDMCDRMHGHNWRVRLTVRVEADALGEVGMGVDFRVIEQTVRDIVGEFEHRYLNELEPFREHPPSAERIAEVVCRAATERLAGEAPQGTVDHVEVWEMPEYRVIFRP